MLKSSCLRDFVKLQDCQLQEENVRIFLRYFGNPVVVVLWNYSLVKDSELQQMYPKIS